MKFNTMLNLTHGLHTTVFRRYFVNKAQSYSVVEPVLQKFDEVKNNPVLQSPTGRPRDSREVRCFFLDNCPDLSLDSPRDYWRSEARRRKMASCQHCTVFVIYFGFLA